MATGDINLQPDESKPLESIKKVNLFTMFRLGLFQMGLGMMAVLALGILNRVMIGELAIPATIAAGTIAMHQFIAPARVWFGQMSDSKPLFGFHRTGYVWVGAALFAIASFLAVQVMWQLGNVVQAAGGWVWTTQTYGWTAVLALIFALYGLALSMSSTPFAALLVDVSDEDNRSQLVGIVWSMLMVGIVLGAIIGGTLLKKVAADAPLSELQASVNQLFMIVPVGVFGLALLATVGVEKKYSRYTSRSTLVDREDKITLGKALRVLTANRQTGIFFTFLLVMTISLFMQEAVMEPYGGEVFGMQVSETTKLNAYWGTGTLLGISITGFLIVPRLGKQKTTKLGCLLVAATFGLIILSGFTHNQKLLQGALLLFGLASGVTTTGAVSLMLDLTAAETAGTFIGAWGLSQAMARAIATVTGGAVLDVGKSLFTTNLVLAYGLVFALQAVGMVVAVWFLSQVDVTEFRDNAKVAIATVLEGELD
ncbi:BCD family MFS transporter [Funiculus sociatus GB2-A5]|uniref:BCD family MFS transporter n=1 Tax=Funiculus sociatus GB2-A5 TaxID=2933946 RepID=A0ABV0JTC5_9CYAN|nr:MULTISPECIES: BCD family MFS transporter [unclassified Trichocoleus]MBD1905338.1 BCD family MFS transporter [Trichocoleus sp. FACHB-832]MBD2065794.1 BCD family MFS transporter [Trichocoleus sp. FACHB-6]